MANVMNYLQSLLTLDAAALADLETSSDEESKEPARSRETLRLIRSIVSEAECCATFLAVSASVCNALADPRLSAMVSPRAFQTYVIPALPVFAAALPRMIDGELLPELAAPFQAFEARVNLARRMALAYASEAIGTATRSTVDLGTLQDAFANACNAAVDLLASLSEASDLQSDGNPEPSKGLPQDQLLGILRAAAAGGHPCVEADGCVIVPGWAERRKHLRQAAVFAVTITVGDEVQTARAFDIARGGIGLDGVSCLASGQEVDLTLPDGRILPAKIAWVGGSKAGATLLDVLPAGDPLLSI